jgi:acyl carrier protein
MTVPTQLSRTREQIHDTLWRLAAKHADKEVAQIGPNSRMVHDLGADSLAMVEFSMELEDELGVPLPEELLEKPDVTLAEIEAALTNGEPPR